MHPLRAVTGALIAPVVMAAVMAAPVPDGPTPARADAGRPLLLFERNGTVVTARADGSDHEVVAGQESVANEPAWSPDGALVAYTSWDPETDEHEVRIVNTRGTGDRVVMSGGTDVDWAPDGQRLVVAVRGEGLVTVRPDGTGRRQITTVPEGSTIGGEPQPAAEGDVRWSPDGSRIAFTRFDPLAGRSRADLFLVDPDGTDLRQVTDSEDHQVDGLDWAPDGSRLAFHRVTVGEPVPEPTDVYTVDAEGTELRRLTHTGEAFWPAWSPEGSRLALAVGDPSEDARDLFVVDGDGTGLRRLADHPSDVNHPDWSPDGAVIAFTGRTCCISGEYRPRVGTDVYAVDADGTGPRRVTDDTQSGTPVFAPDHPVAFEVSGRVAGADRYATAAAVSAISHDEAEAVVVARGDDYADALAAAPLAGSVGGPVLLSRHDRLPEVTVDEIARLSPSRAFVLGGHRALAEGVDERLREAGVDDVVRLAGDNRFDTARLVADRLDSTQAYVVEGAHPDPSRGWPDAVAVSALAAHQQSPVLLTHRDRLPTEAEAAVRALDPETATVVGGPAAVGHDVVATLRDEGAEVHRLAGEDRYATSRAVADAAVASGLDGRRTWLATGLAFPDALTGGPAAAADSGVLLLVHGSDLDQSAAAMDWVDTRAGTFERIMLLGGPAAVDETARREIERAAR